MNYMTYSCALIFSANASLEAAPTIWSTISPSLKKRIAGIDLIPYFTANLLLLICVYFSNCCFTIKVLLLVLQLLEQSFYKVHTMEPKSLPLLRLLLLLLQSYLAVNSTYFAIFRNPLIG